jgi:deazaflavin-dependent oxidoreductase (nitroreductase family)
VAAAPERGRLLLLRVTFVTGSALNRAVSVKRQVVHRVQRLLVNPVGRKMPGVILETTGRKSGQPRRTAVGGRVVDNQFWMVSEHGEHSDYVHNIKANPAVRVRVNGQWRSGTAHLLPDDDPLRRLGNLPRLNSAVVRLMGSDLLTIRVDLD